MSKLFEPLAVKGITLPNRFVRSATVENLGRQGLVTDSLELLYRELARGEVLSTAKQLARLTRTYGSGVSIGPRAGHRIPLYAVGYRGWSEFSYGTMGFDKLHPPCSEHDYFKNQGCAPPLRRIRWPTGVCIRRRQIGLLSPAAETRAILSFERK